MQSKYSIAKIFGAIFLLATQFIVSISYSQPSKCDGILMPDITITNNEYVWAQTMINIFQSNHIETYDDYKNFKGNATIPIEGVPWTFGSEITASNFKEFKDNLYKYNSLSAESRSKINETLKSLSNNAIQAWEKCQNQFGFHVWLLQGADPKSFTLAATYRGQGNIHLRNISFSQPVTTTKGGIFSDEKLNANTNYKWGDGVQYQTFTRTNVETINIDVNPKEEKVGEGLHVQLPKITNTTPLAMIEIADGELNANAVVTGIGVRPPENPSYHTSFHPISTFTDEIGPTLDYEAGFAHTKASAKTLIKSEKNYKWVFDLQNICGGTSIGDGGGGSGYVFPTYRTTIALPPLNSKSSAYTLNFIGSCHVDLEGQEGEGKPATVTISGNGMNKVFSFKVDKGFVSDTLKISDIKPGWYTLILQMPKMGGGSAGLPDGSPDARKRITYQTNLSVEVLANEKNEPSTPNSTPLSNTNWTLMIMVGSFTLLAIMYLIFKNKRP